MQLQLHLQKSPGTPQAQQQKPDQQQHSPTTTLGICLGCEVQHQAEDGNEDATEHHVLARTVPMEQDLPYPSSLQPPLSMLAASELGLLEAVANLLHCGCISLLVGQNESVGGYYTDKNHLSPLTSWQLLVGEVITSSN